MTPASGKPQCGNRNEPRRRRAKYRDRVKRAESSAVSGEHVYCSNADKDIQPHRK